VQLCTIKPTKLEFVHNNTDSIFYICSFSAPIIIIMTDYQPMNLILFVKRLVLLLLYLSILYAVNNNIIIKTKPYTHARVHNMKIYQPVLRETNKTIIIINRTRRTICLKCAIITRRGRIYIVNIMI